MKDALTEIADLKAKVATLAKERDEARLRADTLATERDASWAYVETTTVQKVIHYLARELPLVDGVTDALNGALEGAWKS